MQKFIRIYTPDTNRYMACDELPFEEARELIGGYIETHKFGDLTVMCDEDGRLLLEPPSVSIGGTLYVGTVLVCKFDRDGVVRGVGKKDLQEFERNYGVRYFVGGS